MSRSTAWVAHEDDYDDEYDDDWCGEETCDRCFGDGYYDALCPDDICHGRGECMDTRRPCRNFVTCPECKGKGYY